MKSPINSILLQAIFENFREKYITNVFNGKAPYGRGPYSPEIWTKKDEKNYIALNIFGGDGIRDPQYFHRKYLESLKKDECMVSTYALNKVLKYIGIEPASNVIIKPMTPIKVTLEARLSEFRRKFDLGEVC